MMAGLFFIYLLSLFLIFIGKRKMTFALVIVNLLLCLLMLLHHATDKLNIRL